MTSLRALFAPSHRLIGLFLLVTLVPSVLLMAFGWRLLQQDQEIERQQLDARREQALDLIVSALEQSVASTENALRHDANRVSLATTADSVVILSGPGAIEELSPRRLIYLPEAHPGRAIAHAVLARGEELEHRDQNPRAAASWFRRLSNSAEETVRAGALFAYARNLRKLGAYEEALKAYRDVISLRHVAIEGMPADLLAHTARCSLLRQLNRTAALEEEAAELRTKLLRGDWRLDRPGFELNLEQANRWAGNVEKPSGRQVALASIVSGLAEEWRSGRAAAGRRTIVVDRELFTVLVQRDADRLVALVAGPDFARGQWAASVQMPNALSGPALAFRDAGFRPSDLTANTRVRSAAETGLPWTVVVHDSEAAESAVGGRRTLWITGMVILGVLVAGGTCVVARAVSRELAVARLQADFVAAVSHEFRTPLTSLRQLSEMLLDRPHPPERTRAYYEALRRQTERLHRLVEALLDFGRMEAAASPYRLQPLDAGALVRSVAEEFRADAAARGHAVTVHTVEAPVRADPDALTNAVWNLLDNAAKYSPGGDAIRVDVREDGRDVLISVEDRGFGIPEGERRDIWRKFVRGSRAKAEGIKGTGIGLAMVSHIVAGHQGHVDVSSEPGAPTTFTIRLPLVRERAARSAQAWLES